jgi:hypothetical protein
MILICKINGMLRIFALLEQVVQSRRVLAAYSVCDRGLISANPQSGARRVLLVWLYETQPVFS